MAPQHPNPADVLAILAQSQAPHLIGVRHHSPSLAAAMPALLEAAQPDVLLLELPADLQSWLPWLAHPDTEAPVALAAEGTAFYPFADFSPELAAVRWCQLHSVPVVAFDRPIGAEGLADTQEAGSRLGLGEHLEQQAQAASAADLWDQLVEARAADSSAEALRRAALLAGWALRLDAGALACRDAAREAHMRQVLAEQQVKGVRRPVAVVGSFHAAALIEPGPGDPYPRAPAPTGAVRPVTSALLPYAFELFDDRSGYPAGIRDPAWRQALWSALPQGAAAVHARTEELLVDIARHLRSERHVAGLPDVAAATQMTRDLAQLRGLPAPGRAELLQAVMSALGQGEPLGRGRVLARALESVLVGRRRGRVAPGAPRCGLAPHVEALLRELKLPGPDEAGKNPQQVRLDPLRSPLDRRRHVALHQLAACQVPYGELRTGEGEFLTAVWSPQWTPATEAMLAVASLRGATLPQAAEGALRAEYKQRCEQGDRQGTALLDSLEQAGECGLVDLAATWAGELVGVLGSQGELAELVRAVGLHDRIAAGHVAGLLIEPVRSWFAPDTRVELLRAAVRHLEALAGATDLGSAQALLELVQLAGELDSARLRAALDQLAAQGSPLMQGAAAAAKVHTGQADATSFGVDAASVFDWTEPHARAGWWQGAWAVAGAQIEADPALLQPLAQRVEQTDDASFLRTLPSLREGFEALSPGARSRLLEELDSRLGLGRQLGELRADPAWLAQVAAADAAGQRAAEAVFGPWATQEPTSTGESPIAPTAQWPDQVAGALSSADRWRLILGRQNQRRLCQHAAGFAHSLEALYGFGQGEGSEGDLAGSDHEAQPTVREWAGELEALFGAEVREEVLARAAERGEPQAALELDPDQVRPSVDLLQAILQHKGGLAEGQLTHLRKLVDRIIAQLVQELAVRLRPALCGLGTPQVTRRPRGPLDLRRTLQANLRGVRPDRDPPLLPETFRFRTRAKRSLDWRVIVVVDVSGSMEPSVIYAALVAAILAGMPAFSVDFLAFSTKVVDLSEHVSDPLGLLLEVQVGGGTYIGKALQVARERVRVPNRTLLLLLSDFEDGGPQGLLLEQVRVLVESGVIALGLAALDDVGQPRYSRSVAERVAAAGMPVAALTPLALAQWIGEQVR